jgi:hypothetical protein
MHRVGKNPDRDFCAGYARPATGRYQSELLRLASDPGAWGEPLIYGDLVTDPAVQSRIGRLIVQSARKRPRHRRR